MSDELQQRLDALEAENKRLRKAITTQRTIRAGAVGLGLWVFAGKGLTFASRAWMDAYTKRAQFPRQETADLAAALMKRALKVGVVGGTLALAPTMVLVWQNVLIGQQNTYFQLQNQKLQEQIQAEQKESQAARKAALIKTMYDCEVRTVGEEEETCVPLETPRARAEAATAYVEVVRLEGQRQAEQWLLENPPPKVWGQQAVGWFSVWNQRVDGPQEVPEAEPPDLREALLMNTPLEGSQFEKAFLQGANLQNARFQGANLRGANLRGANLQQTQLQGSTMSGAYLFRADLRGAHLRGADMRAINLEQANLYQIDLRDARMRDAILVQTDLREAYLQEANLRKANLEEADLRKANLEGAHLQGSSFRGANLQEATLSSAELRGADLSGADLRGAIANERTRWPDDFDYASKGVLLVAQ